MTVSHVARLQKMQRLDGTGEPISPISKYRVGFNECANEVIRYLGEYRDGNCSELRTRLLNHLAGCIETSNFMRRGTLGQCGKETRSNDHNCSNSHTGACLKDITFQNQTYDADVKCNDTVPLQRDSARRKLRFHGNLFRSETSSNEIVHSRLEMPGVNQPEQPQYGMVMNRNHCVERQKTVQMVGLVNGNATSKANMNATNIENIFSDGKYKQNGLCGYTDRRRETEAARGSLLNKHVNQLSARDTYANGPLPLFTRIDKYNNRQTGGQIGPGTAQSDCFNKLGPNSLCTVDTASDGKLGNRLTYVKETVSRANVTSDNGAQLGFHNDIVWRPW